MTAYVCPTCGSSLDEKLQLFAHQKEVALHRQQHERVEKRRAQWRDSKRRKYARLRAQGRLVGALHNLRCGGKHGLRAIPKGCHPIPFYDVPQ